MSALPISHANWAATMRTNVALFQSGRYGPWGTGETLLTLQQIMHGTGFLATFPFIEMALPQVIAARFDAAVAVDAVERFGITATMLVPLMLSRLTEVAAGRDPVIRSLRHVHVWWAARSLPRICDVRCESWDLRWCKFMAGSRAAGRSRCWTPRGIALRWKATMQSPAVAGDQLTKRRCGFALAGRGACRSTCTA